MANAQPTQREMEHRVYSAIQQMDQTLQTLKPGDRTEKDGHPGDRVSKIQSTV
jgi:hypothetical protein